MSTTIFEALQNAKVNLVEQQNVVGTVVGREQLSNAVTLLEKGYGLEDNIDTIVDEHGSAEKAPDKK